MEQTHMEQKRSAPVNWEWIGSAWRVFSDGIFTWIMMQVLLLVFVVITVSPIILMLGGIGILVSREEWPGLAGLSLIAILLIPLILILLLVGGAFLAAGLYKTAIRKARGEEIVLTDLFSATDSLPGVLGYMGIMVVVFIAIATLLGNVGGDGGLLNGLTSLLQSIINMVILGLTIFAIPLIVDRRAGVIESIRESVALTLPHWPYYALLAFISEILSSLGIILCLVGIVITFHFQWTIPAVAYCDVFGLRVNPYPVPPPPPDFRAPADIEEDPRQQKFEWKTEGPTLPLACPHCGATLNRVSQFCSQCGTRIGGA